MREAVSMTELEDCTFKPKLVSHTQSRMDALTEAGTIEDDDDYVPSLSNQISINMDNIKIDHNRGSSLKSKA